MIDRIDINGYVAILGADFTNDEGHRLLSFNLVNTKGAVCAIVNDTSDGSRAIQRDKRLEDSILEKFETFINKYKEEKL